MIRTIAFYLPQFHPIPENNRWWGPGFTEWHNVARSQALFRGHRQPRQPGELGYYDLRNEDTRQEQAKLAQEHGIDAFCYYHYWFHGKRLLETPLERLLANPAIDFPFCLAWANENWTRAWDGKDREMLMPQEYSSADHEAHIQYLCTVFRDPRYLRVEGCPLMVVYRPASIPDLGQMVELWQREARKQGFAGLHLCAVRSISANQTEAELQGLGFDSVIDFQPNNHDFPPRNPLGKFVRLLQRTWNGFAKSRRLPQLNSVLRIDYCALRDRVTSRYQPGMLTRYPCVIPNWDNSPRKKEATIIQSKSPRDFSEWVARAVKFVRNNPEDRQLVFVNAWNEWAESAHLEPDQTTGRTYLEAFRTGRAEGESQ
jgi:lipopolysaccharide biosynthesis protein